MTKQFRLVAVDQVNDLILAPTFSILLRNNPRKINQHENSILRYHIIICIALCYYYNYCFRFQLLGGKNVRLAAPYKRAVHACLFMRLPVIGQTQMLHLTHVDGTTGRRADGWCHENVVCGNQKYHRTTVGSSPVPTVFGQICISHDVHGDVLTRLRWLNNNNDATASPHNYSYQKRQWRR